MKKLPVFTLLALLAVACGSKPVQHEKTVTSIETIETEEDLGPIPYKPPVMGLEALNQPYAEIFNDSNYIQYASAERIGILPMHRLRDTYQTRRPLVKVETGDHYVIDNLTHSMPYLVPEAAELLDELGKEFGDLVEANGGSRGNKFIVTSLLRSPYTVKKLQKVNTNAVDSSTHMFATTFDIAYNNFACADSTKAMDGGKLKRLLAEVLLKKRNEGKCFVKYELKSPCFHITVTR